MKVVEKPELKVDVAELRAQMGRANVNQTSLAEHCGVHRNTIRKVLENETADLETIAAIAAGLNKVLGQAGQALISPLDLLLPVGFPSPQLDASVAMSEPAFS